MIDVLTDGAGEQLHPRSARKALRAIVLQRGRTIVRMLRQHVRQTHRVLHRLTGALREILQHRMRGIAEQRDAAIDPALAWVAVAQHPELPVPAMSDDGLRAFMHMAKALHYFRF